MKRAFGVDHFWAKLQGWDYFACHRTCKFESDALALQQFGYLRHKPATLGLREDVVSLARVSRYRVGVRGFSHAGKRERFDAAAECAADVCGVSYNDLPKALINWLCVVKGFLGRRGSFAISKANLRSNEGCKPMERAVSSWNGCFA